VDIRPLPLTAAAQKISDDGIDVLVDLTGFTQTSRSGIAAMRPAPIQVNWLGFPGTMGGIYGKPVFDYILSDAFVTPPEHAAGYSEKLALLPCYQPNDRKRPLAMLPNRKDCGLPDNAFVFCCFNQTFKILPQMFDIWMRLLQAKPDSVLWLLECNRWAKANLCREAELRGIDAARLVFAPRVPISEHLARHTLADLFLDTLPYNAHTTASDALWMGLPIVTCSGETFAGRVAGSLLTAAELPELITYSLVEYESLAMRLAANPDELAAIRNKLKVERNELPLFDTPGFVMRLEQAYSTMLQKLADGQPPQTFSVMLK
jgi:predicted O-linked N-acetylglucosamine transferase (SPINDLY family)